MGESSGLFACQLPDGPSGNAEVGVIGHGKGIRRGRRVEKLERCWIIGNRGERGEVASEAPNKVRVRDLAMFDLAIGSKVRGRSREVAVTRDFDNNKRGNKRL